MGGLFGVITRNNCADDLFYGLDYHSHLGTTIGGIAVLSDKIMEPIYHDISNSQFKSEFKEDFTKINGNWGIGIISSRKDDKQPLIFQSKIGTFALCTDGAIKNSNELALEMIENGVSFNTLTNGFNLTELVGKIICTGNSITDGISKMYQRINGSVSILLLSEDEKCIYASSGVFPLSVGKKKTDNGEDWAIASETTAFSNLKYKIHEYPRYKDIITIGETGLKRRMRSKESIVFCPFLHVYFDFPTSNHYGINGEIVRERCGGFLAEDDDVDQNLVMGVADSGIPHAFGYVKRKTELAIQKSKEALNLFTQKEIGPSELKDILLNHLESITPLRRPVIKFTPGWGRSYIPPHQGTRDLIAYFKQVSNPQIIRDQSIVLVDDSIRRGTQLQKFLKNKIWPYEPKEIHARIASPPQLFPCYFDETTLESDLIARRAVKKIEDVEPENLSEYQDVNCSKYRTMVDIINESIGATSLKYISLKNMIKAVIEVQGNTLLKENNLCTYCWTGKNPF
ncbi:MAG: amidophosphoribosyltransferase [Candidatus Bathyarchaeota archaeon]|nr:MAG: amidophosphoribosyltransferase [Candidatus Bathyarchaeota archaeon]